MSRPVKLLRIVPDPNSASGERLALVSTTTAFDYRRLTELHYALRFADEAVQMARGLPRFDDPTLTEMAAQRDAAVTEALAKLREVLP
jgi:hypothetical protein